MNKDKQIEEMAKLACSVFDGNCHNCSFTFYPPCPPKASAERLYNAGYRKQSKGEWVPSDALRGEDEEWRLYACSVCQHQTEAYYRDVRDLSRFCPHCGTKLKGD